MTMQRVAVINVVGLTRSLIGEHTPFFRQRAESCGLNLIQPAFPAVTCTAQSTYLTGTPATDHGIVGNGWYDRDLAEVHFWKQSNHLVQGRKLGEDLKAADPAFTWAKVFWWYNMYSGADYSVTPRPIYPSDGRKVFDIYTHPLPLRPEMKKDLGEFPFATFWGPAAGQSSPQGSPDAASAWIARSAQWLEDRFHPTLSLVYLPHLDYNLQRLGPQHPDIGKDLKAIDTIAAGLTRHLEKQGVQVLFLSEYGITPVQHPIHLNRLFRRQGWITVKDELGHEMLDAGASRVFAVADHQVAHVYLNDAGLEGDVVALLEKEAKVAQVIRKQDHKDWGIAHSRAGDLVVTSQEDAWFTYYYWEDDAVAPDFARCVDIHRKPGYDPVELFLDPQLAWPKARIAGRLLQKKLGLRMLMDVIPLDATLVKGSHGIIPSSQENFPIFIPSQRETEPDAPLAATDIYQRIRTAILG